MKQLPPVLDSCRSSNTEQLSFLRTEVHAPIYRRQLSSSQHPHIHTATCYCTSAGAGHAPTDCAVDAGRARYSRAYSVPWGAHGGEGNWASRTAYAQNTQN